MNIEAQGPVLTDWLTGLANGGHLPEAYTSKRTTQFIYSNLILVSEAITITREC